MQEPNLLISPREVIDSHRDISRDCWRIIGAILIYYVHAMLLGIVGAMVA